MTVGVWVVAGLVASTRRKARSVALQALYAADIAHHSAQASVEELLLETTLPPQAQQYAREVVGGVAEHKKEIDELIQVVAPLWPLDQVPAVDLNVLRLAIFEILFNNRGRSTPPGAIINEAVDLAKRFGSEHSARFVNGVLGKVAGNMLGVAGSETT